VPLCEFWSEAQDAKESTGHWEKSSEAGARVHGTGKCQRFFPDQAQCFNEGYRGIISVRSEARAVELELSGEFEESLKRKESGGTV